MKDALEVGYYDIDEIMSRESTDTNLYRFEFSQDIGWEDSDFGKDAAKLNKYYKEENKDKFIELYNEYYSEPFIVDYIHIMKGPGGGWPEAEVSTVSLMTIRDFMHLFNEYNGCDIDEMLDMVAIMEVEEK